MPGGERAHERRFQILADQQFLREAQQGALPLYPALPY